MKAMVYRKYGSPDVLELREVDKPTITERDVLVRVRAASVNPFDWHVLTGTPWVVRFFSGLLRPRRRILGIDVAGTVEAVGGNASRFRPGDAVFGTSDLAGAFAEFMRVPEDGLAPKPANLSFEEAASVPTAALTALQALRDKGRIRPRQKVLINGAGGGVGTFAIQIAKSFDAEVTGVCSTTKLDTVRSIGADHVIDYAREDFARADERYDLILDLVGNRPVADCRRALRPEGIYVAAAGSPVRLLGIAMTGGQRTVAMIARPNQEDLLVLNGLLEAGKLVPVIDRRHPLSLLPEALEHVGGRHARGKVVITV